MQNNGGPSAMDARPEKARGPSVRNPFFWIALVLFVAVCVWWMGRVPGDAERLWRLMPAGAEAVTLHEQPLQTLRDALQNPALESAMEVAGVDLVGMQDLLASDAGDRLIEALAEAPLVTAYYPGLAMTRGDTWVAGAWLGGQSRVFRWLLLAGGMDATRVGHHRGRGIWQVAEPASEDGTTRSWWMSVVPGCVVLCGGEDPAAIRRVLDTWDGLWPALDRPAWEEGAIGDAVSDRLWMRSRELGAGASWTQMDVLALDADSAEVRITAPAAWATHPSTASAGPPAVTGPMAPEGMLDNAVLGASVDLQWLKGAAAEVGGSFWGVLFSESVWGACDAVTLGLLGDPFQGRITGFKVPCLVVAIPKEGLGEVDARIQSALDQINASFSLGLIQKRVPQHDGSVMHIIETSLGLPYAAFPPEDRIVVWEEAEWVTIASHQGALERLRAALTSSPSAGSALESGQPVHALVQVDLMPTLRIAENVLGVYRLMRMVQGDLAGAETVGRRLDAVQPWLAAMADMNRLEIRLDESGRRPVWHVRLGSTPGLAQHKEDDG